MADYIYPGREIWCGRINQATACQSLPQSYIGFDSIIAQKDGLFHLDMRVIHNGNSPALFEVSLDNRATGLLPFEPAKNKWQKKGFPLSLKPGIHTIRIYSLSNVSGGDNEIDETYIDYMELSRLGKKSKEVRDDRLKPERKQIVSLPENITTFDPNGERRGVKLGWHSPNLPKENLKIIRTGFPDFPFAFRVEAGRTGENIEIASRPFEVQPGEFLYFSTLIRPLSVYNHFANCGVVFLDKDKNLLDQFWLSREGLDSIRASDWIYHSCFRKAPKGTDKAAIVFILTPTRFVRTPAPDLVLFSLPRNQLP